MKIKIIGIRIRAFIFLINVQYWFKRNWVLAACWYRFFLITAKFRIRIAASYIRNYL